MLRKAVTLAVMFLVFATSARAQKSTEEQAERLVNILRTTNKAQVNYYVPKVFNLRYVNPYAVVRFIHRTLQPEEGALYTFAEPGAEGGKVIVIAPRHQLDSIAALISQIDRPRLTSSSGEAREFVKLKHRSVADGAFLDTLASNGQFSNFVLLTDPQLDALYLKDLPSAMKDHINYLATEWDVPTEEVACDVTIYEIDANNDNTVGLDFHAWKNGPGRNLFALGAFAEYEQIDEASATLSGIDLGGSPPFDSGSNLLGIPARQMSSNGANAAWFYDVPSSYFDYLNTKGHAKIVNKSKVTILNAHQGSISTGDQILYYQKQNGTAPSGGVRPPGASLDQHGDNESYPDNRTVVGKLADRVVDGATITGQIFDRHSNEAVDLDRTIAAAESGVFLDLVPIIADDMITFDLAYTVAQLSGFDGEGKPQLASRTTRSTVRTRSGQELILGGLVREAKIKNTRKVPILGSIPVLGYWFGGEISTAKRSLVAIVLKPQVVNNFDTLTGTEEERIVDQVREVTPTTMPAEMAGFDMLLMNKPVKDDSISRTE